MTGKEEFEPLDELFRKTFQDLPETPSASGWDMPSPRVWQRVQGEIKPATSGWAFQTWATLALLAVLLSVGLYYFFGRSQPPAIQPPAPVQIEQPVATPATSPAPTQEITPSSAPAEKPVVNPTAKIRPAVTESHPTPNQAVNHTTPGSTDPGRVQASPLLGSKPAVPNSTERKKSGEGAEN